ncbi:Hydrolase activity protein [Homalodisca vitripennis]|nr:Hydrolase activity protein [Homalodisca vitripennis]
MVGKPVDGDDKSYSNNWEYSPLHEPVSASFPQSKLGKVLSACGHSGNLVHRSARYILVTTIIVSPQAVHWQGAVRVPSLYTRSTAYFFSPDSKYSQSYSGSYNYNVQTRPNYDRSHIVPVRASNPTKAAEPVQSQNYGKSNNPVLDFLSPSGLRITFPGPYSKSSVYLLKFHVNINHEFNGVKRGDWNEDVTLLSGSTWSHTFPDIKLTSGDIVYYWVEVKGQDGTRLWFREYKGFYHVPRSHSMVETQQRPMNPQIQSSSSQQSMPSKQTVPLEQSVPPRKQLSGVHSGQQTTTLNRQTISDSQQPPVLLAGKPVLVPVSNVKTDSPIVPDTMTDPNISQNTMECLMSETTYNHGKKPCGGQPVVSRFEFNTIEQIGGYEPEDKFTVFSHNNIVKNVSNYNTAVDTITPVLLEDRYGPNFVDRSLRLQDCTSKDPSLCNVRAMGYFILPPVVSGRETTENTVFFRYGTLEVIAKLPSGDWVVPELWLLPKDRIYGDKSGRIVMALSRGNQQLTDGVQDYSNRVLEAGVETSSGRQMFRIEQSYPWSDDYHKFKLVWTPDKLQFFVDNREIGRIQPVGNRIDPFLQESTKMAPFDQEFYLVCGVHVGGEKDFPDSLIGKPWENKDPKNKVHFWRAREKWKSTWTEDTALHVAGITLTSLKT